MSSYRIMLADDHALLRMGIKRIIDEFDGMAVVAQAGDGLELLALLDHTPADMTIVDLSMPCLGGIETTQRIKQNHPAIKVLILTMHRRREYFYRALAAGADGYLLKEDTDTELLSAVETIRNGKTYVSPSFLKELTTDLVETCRRNDKPRLDCLTDREKDVLKLLTEGKSSKEIASELFISIRTVEHHRASIAKRLNIRNVADLVKYAIRRGYASDTDMMQ
ncbi:response regulator transcription factor [Candidatus Poribacteria bacterium]|nr:response regulator transcription factor [Candidatus Poribacteria bacterium]